MMWIGFSKVFQNIHLHPAGIQVSLHTPHDFDRNMFIVFLVKTIKNSAESALASDATHFV